MFDWLPELTPPAELAGTTLIAYALFNIFLIVILARILGNLFARIGQPRVVGEILAGILLGPTLLGDNLSQVIAPLPVRPLIGLVATLGLIMFMFLAGIEFDLSLVKGRTKHAGFLALLSIAVPALLGFPVGLLIHNDTYAGPAGDSLLPFALLIGAALSVTAFPVMAHILLERGELNTGLGALAVATAGIMSVLMFTYIAFAGAMATAGGLGGLFLTVVWILVFGLGSWFLVRPLASRLLAREVKGETISGTGMAFIFGGMILYGLIADRIGINALVGGFVWGMILPTDLDFRKALAAKVRDVALVLFLPVFFASAGYAADLKLLTPATIPAVALVLLGAIAGKFLAVVPARSFGLSWRETTILGALFNTRGLLVLVVGLIGLDLEIITISMFTILVIVALVTNLMTLPLLNRFSQRIQVVSNPP